MKGVPLGCSDAAKDGHAIARISPITSPASICKGKAKLTRVVPLAALVMSEPPNLTDFSRADRKPVTHRAASLSRGSPSAPPSTAARTRLLGSHRRDGVGGRADGAGQPQRGRRQQKARAA